MRISILLLGISLSTAITTTVALQEADGQIIDIKPWHGDYPEMKGSYPLTFIAFKGGLFPTPYVFVRTWPTHYYVMAPSLPVSDGDEYASLLKTGLLKIAAKMFERSQMKGRYEATKKTRDDTQVRKDIGQKIFDARSDELPDIYGLAERFIRLYKGIDRFDGLGNSTKVKKILQKDADGLLMRFVMANLLDSDHGQKLEAFAGIRSELDKLSGETDYTYRKIIHLNTMGEDLNTSYAFMSQ
jgi:hypothetical protein